MMNRLMTGLRSQPTLAPPPIPDFSTSITLTRIESHTSRATKHNAETRTLISRASSVASRMTRKPRRRPTISSPSDFRRVEGTLEDLAPRSFRPLQLSIYIPGNELPPLPSFNAEDFEALRALVPPPAAHTVKRSQSDTILSRRCSSVLVINPRVMVPPSRQRISTAESFYSSSSDDGASLSPSMLDRAHSIYVEAVSSLPHGQGQSTHSLPASQAQFLSLLDDGPRPPVPLKVSKYPLTRNRSRSRSRSPDPVRRNASDQNMRLRAHLEERQEMESRLQNFDTIMEEWENDMSVSGSTGSEDAPSSLSRASSSTSTASSASNAPRAESTVLSTMERALAQRTYNSSAQFTKSAPHLPLPPTHTHPLLPQSLPPPMPALPPSAARNSSTPSQSQSQSRKSYKSFHLRSLEPPFPPPTYAPPANPEQRRPQVARDLALSPSWYPQVSRGSYEKVYQRHISSSTATLTEECPSLSSAGSTPMSSPRRGDGGVPSPGRQAQAVSTYRGQDIVQDIAKSPVRIEYGVAF
ncbi:hypothetical protein MMC30_006694 [Trapelia coarctata]|nr:hypothetical protein [Trapelia coarctata]